MTDSELFEQTVFLLIQNELKEKNLTVEFERYVNPNEFTPRYKTIIDGKEVNISFSLDLIYDLQPVLGDLTSTCKEIASGILYEFLLLK